MLKKGELNKFLLFIQTNNFKNSDQRVPFKIGIIGKTVLIKSRHIIFNHIDATDSLVSVPFQLVFQKWKKNWFREQ